MRASPCTNVFPAHGSQVSCFAVSGTFFFGCTKPQMRAAFDDETYEDVVTIMSTPDSGRWIVYLTCSNDFTKEFQALTTAFRISWAPFECILGRMRYLVSVRRQKNRLDLELTFYALDEYSSAVFVHVRKTSKECWPCSALIISRHQGFQHSAGMGE